MADQRGADVAEQVSQRVGGLGAVRGDDPAVATATARASGVPRRGRGRRPAARRRPRAARAASPPDRPPSRPVDLVRPGSTIAAASADGRSSAGVTAGCEPSAAAPSAGWARNATASSSPQLELTALLAAAGAAGPQPLGRG